MVLDVDGEVLLSRLDRNALRNGPRREGAVALEPKVVVEPARVVPLHDEDRPAATPLRTVLVERLRRLRRVALPPVLPQAHVWRGCRRPCLGIAEKDENIVCKRPGFSKEAFPQAGGPTLEAGITGLESCLGQGKRLWILGKAVAETVCSSENAERAEPGASPAPELVAGNRFEVVERLPDRLAQQP